MEFKLDFDDLEQLEKLLREVADSVDEFATSFQSIISEVGDEANGEAINEIISISEEIGPSIESLRDTYEQQADIAKDYIAGIRDVNEDKNGIYELDTSEAKGYINDATNELENLEYLDTDTPSLVFFTSKYENNIKEYNNVEATINLEDDYEDDEDTKALIRAKRIEIDNSIFNYNNNQAQLTSAQDLLTTLNTTMSSYIEDLADYKDILEDLKDFEDTFNPGFWDKHGKTIINVADFAIHTGLSLAGMIPGIGWVADSVNAALYFVEGNKVAALGSALAVVPGLKAASTINKGRNELKVAEEGIENATKIRKATKRKVKGPSSKLSPKYKNAIKNEKMAKKEFESALENGSKFTNQADDLVKIRNSITAGAGIADAFVDENHNGGLDDKVGWVESTLAEKYGKDALLRLDEALLKAAL